MTLRSWARFDTLFLRVRYGVRQTQPAGLLGAVQNIKNSSQMNGLIDYICRIWL